MGLSLPDSSNTSAHVKVYNVQKHVLNEVTFQYQAQNVVICLVFPRHGYLIVAVPRLRFGYRIELRAYSVSVALICLPIHVYLRVLRNLTVMASTASYLRT